MLKFNTTLSEQEFIGIRYSMEQNLERATNMSVFAERLKELLKLYEYVLWCTKMSENAVCGILYTTNMIHLSSRNKEKMNKEDGYVRWFIEHASRLDDIIQDLSRTMQKHEADRLKRRRVVMMYPPPAVRVYQPPLAAVRVDEQPFTEEDAVQAMVDGTSMKREKMHKKN